MRRTSFVLVVVLSMARQSPAQTARPHFRFDFGPGKVSAGFTQILGNTVYDPATGYGFEPGPQVSCLDRGGDDPLRSDFCTSDRPFFFSVRLPEGNYKITVTLGDETAASTTTVKAELRRLMLERVHTVPGQFVVRTFTVNIRTPRISDGREVRLKEREKREEATAWDDKLTLEFNDARPAVCALEITPVDNAVTVFLLGDSTVCDQPLEPWNSWGQMLPRFFTPGVAVANNAESGESLRTSLSAGRLDKVLSAIKPGDYLFIQYGHNDMKEKGEGIGAFTSYKTDLDHFVDETLKHGGTPVLVTSVQRRTFDAEGKITNSLGDYPEAVRRVAKEKGVALIDLNTMSRAFYETMGPENSKKAFVDNTHHNSYGSYELAKCVVEGIKASKLGLASFLVDEARTTFDPAHPDPVETFSIPPSPTLASAKPDGN